MRTRKPALILYLTACILAMVAAAFHNETFLLLTKPIVIPAIFSYYMSAKTTSKTHPLVSVFFILSFIGDTTVLLDFHATLYIMVPYFLSYLILVYFAIDEIRKTPFDKYSAAVGLFIFVFLTVMLAMLVQFFPVEKSGLILPVWIFGIVLFIYASLAGYCFYSTASNVAFYMIMSALFCVVSDVFYVLFGLMKLFPDYLFFDLGLQLFSYFFIARYFILRKY